MKNLIKPKEETNLGSIVRYDSVAGTWNPLPNQGLHDEVIALAASGDDLYMAGNFSGTGDGSVTDLGNIVRFDTTVFATNVFKLFLPLLKSRKGCHPPYTPECSED